MFKLHRHRSSDRVGERFDFRFSNFRAVQVALPPSLPPLSLGGCPKSFLFPHFLLAVAGPDGQGRTDSTSPKLAYPIRYETEALRLAQFLLFYLLE